MTWYITGNNIDPTKNNFLGTINDQPLVIKTFNTEKVRVNPDGNVGIGKAPASGTPYRLDVAGAINATDILKDGVPLGGGEASQWDEVAGGSTTPAATYASGLRLRGPNCTFMPAG